MANRKRNPLLYGLFERQSDGSWIRRYTLLAFPIDQARRVFQDMLLAPAFGAGRGLRELRPVAHGLFWQAK